jgi:hypothetical protein
MYITLRYLVDVREPVFRQLDAHLAAMDVPQQELETDQRQETDVSVSPLPRP